MRRRTAAGNVKFQDHELMLTGSKAILKKQDEVTHTTLEQVKFHYPDLKINGQAQKITNNGTKQVFDSVSLTLCPLGNTDWLMKADQIILNSAANIATAEDVTVEFLGVPIFYLPHYRWVPKGRSSGFLTPSYGVYDESSANEGSSYQVKIPYYFNIAPNRDFLLTLNQLSSRGNVIEGKYRQLIAETNYWKGGRLEAEGHYLNEDDITITKRWLIDSTLNLSLNEKTNLNIISNRVSDTDYFKDIVHNNTSSSALNSHIDASYKDKERGLELSLLAESEQLINSGSASYTLSPKLAITKNINTDDRNIKLSLVSTKFAHKDTSNTTGTRTHAKVRLDRSMITDAYSLTPTLNITTTDYALDNASDQNRSIASFGLDSKLFLEKNISLFNTDLVQTLTPRLAYHYTPKKDQSALPNFDSTNKNDSYEGLFSGQKFTGLDRISNANNLTLGIESDFISEKEGGTYLSLKIAQSFYLDDQEMNDSGALVNRSKDYSNIAGSADLSLDNFTFNSAIQYNPDTNKLDKHNNTVSYQSKPRKSITVAQYVENGTKSAEIYGAYPITQEVHVFGGINRSITDSITNKKTTGIAYESCCWAIRVEYLKNHVDGNNYDNVTNFELVLKGL
jgi:LPS-assembly protein